MQQNDLHAGRDSKLVEPGRRVADALGPPRRGRGADVEGGLAALVADEQRIASRFRAADFGKLHGEPGRAAKYDLVGLEVELAFLRPPTVDYRGTDRFPTHAYRLSIVRIMRRRVSGSGRRPWAAAMFWRMWSTREVAGIAHVIAG